MVRSPAVARGSGARPGSRALGQGTPDQWFQQLAKESLAQIDGTRGIHGLREPVEIIGDRWGVPHIYAKNTDDHRLTLTPAK